eukprot:scaffold1939_cov392-Prasinococcus_capsulatus_cf.AAC.13
MARYDSDGRCLSQVRAHPALYLAERSQSSRRMATCSKSSMRLRQCVRCASEAAPISTSDQRAHSLLRRMLVVQGNLAVGVRGKDTIVLAVEKKSSPKLQDTDTMRKIHMLDEHVCLAFAGLTADARVLVNKARVECQSYRLTLDEAVSLEYITRYIAGVQQKYTQSGGVRPFGISTLIVGFDADGSPKLYQTEPSGTYAEWKANATVRVAAPGDPLGGDGRNSKTIREWLEKNYEETEGAATTKLAIKALLEIVEASGKNIEVAVMRKEGMSQLTEEEVEAVMKEIEAEKDSAQAAPGTTS